MISKSLTGYPGSRNRRAMLCRASTAFFTKRRSFLFPCPSSSPALVLRSTRGAHSMCLRPHVVRESDAWSTRVRRRSTATIRPCHLWKQRRRGPFALWPRQAVYRAPGRALYSSLYGMEMFALRYFNVFGPRQDPRSPYSGVISIFVDLLRSGTSSDDFRRWRADARLCLCCGCR